MSNDIIQIEGGYISSTFPKTIYFPTSAPYSKYSRQFCGSRLPLRTKSKTIEIKSKNKSSILNDGIPPASGRQHLSMQTDLYLEELCSEVENKDVQCETDPAWELLLPPVFVPSKCGVDASTQTDIIDETLVEDGCPAKKLEEQAVPGLTAENELMLAVGGKDLITEQTHTKQSTPIIQDSPPVLEDLPTLDRKLRDPTVIESTVENLLEVAENSTQDQSNVESSQTERSTEEKLEKQEEDEETIRLEDEATQKIVARIFSQNYLSELVPQVYKKLDGEGYFEEDDQDAGDFEESFWPWLVGEVETEIGILEESQQALNVLIDDTVQDIEESAAKLL